MTFPTLPLSAFDAPLHVGAAPADWSGFHRLCPLGEAPKALPVHMLDEGAQSAWTCGLHWKKPLPSIGPIGCFALRDVEIWRPGILVQAGGVIDDANVSTNVALAAARAEADFSDRFGRQTAARRVDRTALVVAGPGHQIWGHWLAEFLPRVAIACKLFGGMGGDWVIPLPADTPAWVDGLLDLARGIGPEAILRYAPGRERLVFPRAILPTFGFSGEYTFHPLVRDFYRSLVPPARATGRRLCLSRGGAGPAANRPFRQRDFFERQAAERGFEVIRPETLGLPEQIAMLSQAAAIIGEYGSAMHGSVFAGPGTVIGCIGQWNAIQMRLGELCGQRGVYLMRGCLWPTADRPMSIDASLEDIAGFLDRVVSLLD